MSYYNNSYNLPATVSPSAAINRISGKNAASTLVVKVGGISRGANLVRRQHERENAEAIFMAISFKASQRPDKTEARRAKR